MRHLGSIVLSFVLASLVYVAAGVGMSKMFQAELERGGPVNRLDAGAMAVGVLLLLVAGALYTLLAMPRISPLGPVLVGLTFIGIQVWSLVAPSGFVKLMPRSVFGVRAALDAPVEFPADGLPGVPGQPVPLGGTRLPADLGRSVVPRGTLGADVGTPAVRVRARAADVGTAHVRSTGGRGEFGDPAAVPAAADLPGAPAHERATQLRATVQRCTQLRPATNERCTHLRATVERGAQLRAAAPATDLRPALQRRAQLCPATHERPTDLRAAAPAAQRAELRAAAPTAAAATHADTALVVPAGAVAHLRTGRAADGTVLVGRARAARRRPGRHPEVLTAAIHR
ncbi:MAG: hypothetical protein AUI14_12660 [Actinobacteria bacterium 13_2_20CM_2_71_6]|nr:MAG: hypothetical protein AUI14_12660 [Actinobacteria bacterium 13_2_20CM_2_71_6]